MPAENHRWVYCEAGNICTRCGQIAVLGADKVCPGPPVPSHREPPRDEEPVQQYVEGREACPLSTPCADVRVCSCGVDNRSPAPRDARDVIARSMTDQLVPYYLGPGQSRDVLYLAVLGSLAGALRDAGLSVVSREPTDEMIERAWEAWMTSGGDRRMILVPHLRAAIRAALSEGDER